MWLQMSESAPCLLLQDCAMTEGCSPGSQVLLDFTKRACLSVDQSSSTSSSFPPSVKAPLLELTEMTSTGPGESSSDSFGHIRDPKAVDDPATGGGARFSVPTALCGSSCSVVVMVLGGILCLSESGLMLTADPNKQCTPTLICLTLVSMSAKLTD